MPTKDEIVEDIDKMSQEVSQALADLENEEFVDLDGIEVRIRVAMDAVANLPPDDAVEMRPILVTLLEGMELFAKKLQVKIDEVTEEEANAPQDEKEAND
jgi:uncharacterized protein HemX